MTPKIGSKWWSGTEKSFYIKAIVELEGSGQYGTQELTFTTEQKKLKL